MKVIVRTQPVTDWGSGVNTPRFLTLPVPFDFFYGSRGERLRNRPARAAVSNRHGDEGGESGAEPLRLLPLLVLRRFALCNQPGLLFLGIPDALHLLNLHLRSALNRIRPRG